MHNIDSHVRLSKLVAAALIGEIIMMKICMTMTCINDKGVLLIFGRKVILEIKLDWWIRFLSNVRDHMIGKSCDKFITEIFIVIASQ